MNRDIPQKGPQLLVIGGGIAGPVLALFLYRAGISCAVYEAYPESENVGGGLNLAPNGMNVLAELGLDAELVATGTCAMESAFEDEKGNLLGRTTYSDPKLYGQPALSMSRAKLAQALARALKEKRIPLYYEKRLAAISEQDESVSVEFEDGTQAKGDVLIGADGVRSTVRKYLLPTGPFPSYVGIIGIGGFTPLAPIPAMSRKDLETITYTFGPNGFFGYGGGDVGTVMWWSNLPRAQEFSRAELAHLDSRAVQRELLERFQSYHEPIPALIEHTNSLLRMNVYDIQSLPTWHKGRRILLIGDAAHAVSPNSGQGASLALEDAMCLAKLMRDCAGDVEGAFVRFESDRKPRVEKIVAEGRRRASDKEIVRPVQSKIRNWIMQLFFKLGKANSDQWILGYKINWEADTPRALGI